MLEQENRQVFVYEENAQVLGFAAFNFPVDAPISELRALYLLQNIQGRGIGRDLVQLGLGLSREKSYQYMQCSVLNLIPVVIFMKRPAPILSVKEMPAIWARILKTYVISGTFNF